MKLLLDLLTYFFAVIIGAGVFGLIAYAVTFAIGVSDPSTRTFIASCFALLGGFGGLSCARNPRQSWEFINNFILGLF